jgi:hypothetical protein
MLAEPGTAEVLLRPIERDVIFDMAKSYAVKDGQFIEYGLEQLHGEWFRGPLNRGPDSIAYLGAAQTFGRFAVEPFPAIIGDNLGLGTLNLGSGGKSPQYFLRRPELLEEVNRCRLAVIQVMAAKGMDNSLFRSKTGGAKGVRLDTGEQVRSLTIIPDLLGQGRDREARKVAQESQSNYVEAMRSLMKAVTPPKILLWISFHEPPGSDDYRDTLDAGFPQLVNSRLVNEIKPSADRFVEVVSRAGIPQDIRDYAGNLLRTNSYYPSPEMHRLAADQLTPVVKELIG